MNNLAPKTDIEFNNNNPNKKIEGLLSETNDKLQKQIKQYEFVNQELQEQLEKARLQLKQLNDKESSQNLYIKELKADLKEEIEKRIEAENTLSESVKLFL